MANKVSFLIKLVNRFSKPARKIQISADIVSKSIGKMSLRFKSANRSSGILSGKLKKVNRESKRLTKQINKGVNPAFASFKGVVAGATLSLAAFFSASSLISAGSGFQDALADLSAITGTTGKELKFLSDESLRLAKSSKIAQSVVALAFKDIASSKSELLKDPKGLSIVTEQALLLANAAGIEVPDAVRASVGALNQFNKGADQAARFVNVIAAGAKVGASSVAQTADALKNAGTVASQFGLTFEQTNSILQVFAKFGLKGAEAGTALRGTLTKLEQFEGGVFAPSKIGIIRSLEIIKKLNLSNIKVTRDFGEENQRSILILRENVPLIKQWTTELTGTNTAQEQANVRLNTFSARLRGLGISIKDKLIKTFLRLEPAISKLVVDMGDFFDTLDPQRVKAFADELGGLLKIVSLLGKGLGLVTSVFTGVGTFIGEEAAKSVEFLAGRGRNVAELKRISEELARQNAAISVSVVRQNIPPLNNTTGLQERIDKKISPVITNKAEILATLNQQRQPINVSPANAIVNLERDKGATARDALLPQAPSKTTVDVNIRAPKNVVESVLTKSISQVPGLNIGVNMVTAI